MQNFNYHSHTYRCGHADFNMEDEDYIKEYIEMGFKKMAFTDHCPQKNEIDKRPGIRMRYEERGEYLKSIKNLKEKYGNEIEIYSGYEIEYLPGEEESLLELKQETDKLILGQHFVYDDNKNLKIFGVDKFSEDDLIRYADYIDKAMQLNIPNIIAHPDIYMLSRDNFGEVEEKVANMICKSAEKYNISLEINLCKIFNKVFFEGKKLNNPSIEEQRNKLINVKYPCKEFWNIAKNYNIKVLYGIDAHFEGQILCWNELVQLANEIIGEDTIKELSFIEE